MAEIASIRSRLFRIPLEETLVDARHGAHDAFELVTVEVTDAEGASGVGYSYTGGRNGGAIHATAAGELPELVLGCDAERIEQVWETVWWALHYGGRGGAAVFALSALDIALWDLKAKRAQMPLWRLLGGYDPAVPCYAGGIDLHLDAAALIAQGERHVERGFRAIKMKVGRDRLAEDVEKLAAMRAHFGADFPLMVDANMKWSVAEAIDAARAFAPYRPIWLEEPTIPDDLEGHARIAAEGGLPVASGENMRTIWEFRHAITIGKIAYPEPDVTNCGGVTPFMKVAHLAEAFNLPVTSHGAHDITVHLMAACPNRCWMEAHGFGLDRYIAAPLRIADGKAIAPETPGHGLAFDWDALSRLEMAAGA